MRLIPGTFLFFWIGTALATAHPAGPTIGTEAPPFQARDLVTGEKVDLAAQRGKIVVLTFWATWCAPCRRELPILDRAQELAGKDKLTVFAVNFQEQAEATATLKRLAKTWHLTLVEDRYGWIAKHYGITAIPHLFIINRSGQIVASHLGYGDRSLDALVSDINKAFADQPIESPDPDMAH